MYFRELPNPLCTYQLYDEFVAAVQSSTDHRIENMRKVVRKLPPPHYRLVHFVNTNLLIFIFIYVNKKDVINRCE